MIPRCLDAETKRDAKEHICGLTMGQDVGGDFMVNLCVERNVEETKICGLKCFFFCFVLIVDFSIDQSEKVIA